MLFIDEAPKINGFTEFFIPVFLEDLTVSFCKNSRVNKDDRGIRTLLNSGLLHDAKNDF